MSQHGAEQTMRLVRARAFGPPDLLGVEQVRVPVPRPGQVLVDVLAAPVLHLDVQIRSGWRREQFGVVPPYVPGSGYVGIVVETGADVARTAMGQLVAVDTGQTGGYVEQAVVDADRLLPVPSGLDPVAVAALLHDGRTALGLLQAVPVQRGDRVLVLGAAGGLGDLLVQLAARRGAIVVAAARGPEKLRAAQTSGAHQAVDYSDPTWPDRACAALGRVPGDPSRFDVIFDGVGGEVGTASFDLLDCGGRFSAHGAPSGSFAVIDDAAARDRHARVTGIETAQLDWDDLARLTGQAFELARSGDARPHVGATFALSEAARAHAVIEARAVIGKTVLITASGQAHGLLVAW